MSRAPARRLPIEHVGVANRGGRLESPEAIPSLPVVPGHAVAVLLAPLDLSGLVRGCRLEHQSGSSDTLELADVALLGVPGGQMDEVPPGQHEVELLVGELRE